MHQTKSGSAFIGRAYELEHLCGGLEDILAGCGRLFLISGEPGIGKTRLAEQLTVEARIRGARVIWGRCWAGDGAPAYWPWIQVVRSCLGQADATRIDKLLTSEAPQVADLLPEMNQMRRSSAVAARAHAVTSSDPEKGRFRLFDSVTRLLQSIADAQPLMIVLDDLQEADQPSLLMLRFSARQLKETRILLIGTYREVEIRNSPALTRLIGEIAREGQQLPLHGLSDSELASWVNARCGLSAGPALISALTRATGGNPLFIDGILRMLPVEEAKLDATERNFRDLRIPGGVRETIRRRLRFVSNEANKILSVAAVIGQEFEFECLRRVVGGTVNKIIEALNEARQDSLIHPVVAGGVNYRFAHDLIRETIYNDLPAPDRASLHLTIGQALEAIHQSDLIPHLAELAHHYRESVAIGDPARAIDYSVRAGEEALTTFAYEEATTHWQAALSLMKSYELNNARQADLLRRLGVLTFYGSDRSQGHKYLLASLDLSMRLGDAHLTALAHAELGFSYGFAFASHMKLAESLRHLKQAEALINPDREPLMLVRIYSQIARMALQAHEPGQGLAAARRGMSLCERLQDQGLWSFAAANCATHLMVIGKPSEAQPLLDRASKTALLVRDPEQSGQTALWLVGLYYIWMRDPPEAQQTFRLALERPGVPKHLQAFDAQFLAITEMFMGNLAEAKKLADSYGINAHYRSQIVFRLGDFEAAKQLQLEHLDQFARKVGEPWNECTALCQLVQVLFTVGDYEGAEAALTQTFRAYPPEHAYWEMRTRPQAVLLALELGQHGKAMEHVEVCRRILKSGDNWRGLAGFVERAEAALEARVGDLAAANERFEKAINCFKRYSLAFDIGDTFHLWGQALVNAGDRASALAKFDAAIDIYRRHHAGQRWIDRVADDRRRTLDTATVLDAARQGVGEPSAEADHEPTFHKQDVTWIISFAGKTSQIRDAKGLHYLACLLRSPQTEFAAVELANSRAPSIGNTATVSLSDFAENGIALRPDLDGATPALDLRARAEYRQRLTDLREELETAERHNDAGRQERLRSEIDLLLEGLKTRFGRGKELKTASHRERARSTVSKRIRFALDQIRKANPELAKHLTDSIRTGYNCAYRPTQKINWNL